MSKSDDQRRRDELARIHILKAELKMDRDVYEDVLWTQARVESAALLDAHGRQQVIRHLEHLAGRARKPREGEPRTLHQRPMLRKIGALLADADREWAYAAAVAKRITGKDALEFCSDAELRKVVAALAIDGQRRAEKPANDPAES